MSSHISFDAASLTQPERFKYLLGSIGPRPICFASTVDKEGKVNLSPYSFFNAFSSSPPILIFSPARNRNREQKDTYYNILEVPEAVINIINYPIVEQQSLASTAYDKGVNEFIKSGLTQIKSDLVRPPRVGESPAAFECKVIEVKEFGDNPGAGCLIICEVLVIHLKQEVLDDKGFPDATKLDLVGRMGGNWYARASQEALFEIQKPIRTMGMGIDLLPQAIRESKVLVGNDLAKLGGIESMPNEEEVKLLLNDIDFDLSVDPKLIHLAAKDLLDQDKRNEALALLLALHRD